MKRIIARLDIKLNKLIKGIHLEGWRLLGDPSPFFLDYYKQGIDELIYIDAVASLYSRSSMKELVAATTRDVFVPLTVGGGIRTLEDAYEMLRSGADKIAVNTGAVKNPSLIDEIATKFGSQCMVLSVQAKRRRQGEWKVCYDSAREQTERDVVDWITEAVDRGAGEILLTSIDQDGTAKGFDLDLARSVFETVDVPVVLSGGFGEADDFVKASKFADGIAIARQLHFKKVTVDEIKRQARMNGIKVRLDES
ncbi:MAG: imidazole glycerol phosphate synthase cyclase subunit [Cytophagales bacterium]|nr:imidazole glycerol phosphate synthase cyclase subunit [Cytophagales bacterium]